MGAFASTPKRPDQVSGKRKRSGEDQTDPRPSKKTCFDNDLQGQRPIAMQHPKLEAENAIECTQVTEDDLEDLSSVTMSERTVDNMTQDNEDMDCTGIVEGLQELRYDIKLQHDILGHIMKWLDGGGLDDEGQFANARNKESFASMLSLIKADLLLAAEQAHDIVEKNCSIAAES